jgi:hypothetical protein
MLRDAGIRALVVSGEHRERFERLLPQLPTQLLCLCDAPADGWTTLGNLMAASQRRHRFTAWGTMRP